MAIESVPVVLGATPPVPSVLPSSQGTGKPVTEGKVDDKQAQAFRDLLEGLDAPVDAPTSGGVLSSDADPLDGGVGGKKLLAPGKSAAGSANTTAADAATWMAAYLSPGAVPLATPVVSPPVTSPSVAMDVLQSGSPLQALKADAAGPVANSAAPSLAAPDARTQWVNLANYASVFEQIQNRLAAGGAAPTDTAGSLAKGPAKPVLGTAAADTRADQMASVASGGVWTLPVTEAAALQATTDATEALKLAVHEAGEQREGALAGALPEGRVGHNHFTPTVHFESAAASVDVRQAAPEAAVADQVSYWISQGIQNAELTFDGADAQPVQVSISLSGNEAHVEFRSDQLETRDLLTGAASHLKDLLRSEGMVLSGLTVGTSGSGGRNDRERRAPPEGRQNTSRSAPEAIAVRPAAPTGASGRAVDLFV